MAKLLLIFTVAFAACLTNICFAFPVQVSEAPVNNLGLTVSAIKSAQSSLLLNIYELSSPDIADAVIDRIEAGVQVQVIEEGQPVGGLSSAAKGIQSELIQAMVNSQSSLNTNDRLFEMTSKAGGRRRFRFDHAKYIVIDGQKLLIGSENYSPTGNPQPGSIGNRGWEVLISDASLARQFSAMFSQDKDPSFGDVEELTQEASASFFTRTPKHKHPIPPQAAPVSGDFPTLDADSATPITSPNSLEALRSAIENAASSIDLELMTFDSGWKAGGTNPLIDALIAAVHRGVQVRVLLNDESVFLHQTYSTKPKNQPTADLLNEAGASARIANVQAMGVDYIHNKGMIIDQNLTLISSINWDENSIMNNRETAVLISGPAVAAHYSDLFNRDWQASAGRSEEISGHFAKETSSAQLACPQALRVSAQIGEIVVNDAQDKSFAALSGQTINGKFKRISGAGCVLSTLGAESVGARKYLEIRRRSDGTTTIQLEGFTLSHKLYSIRAHADSPNFYGAISAALYDGSGPAREVLGAAVMDIEADPLESRN